MTDILVFCGVVVCIYLTGNLLYLACCAKDRYRVLAVADDMHLEQRERYAERMERLQETEGVTSAARWEVHNRWMQWILAGDRGRQEIAQAWYAYASQQHSDVMDAWIHCGEPPTCHDVRGHVKIDVGA